MQPLEIKRLKLDLIRVAAARADLEFRVEERMDEIERIKANIQVQLDTETKLTAKISEAEAEAKAEAKAAAAAPAKP